MPGFDVTPATALKPGLLCCECGLLLREAVQTEDGERLCHSCYEKIKATGSSESGISLVGEVRVKKLFFCAFSYNYS